MEYHLAIKGPSTNTSKSSCESQNIILSERSHTEKTRLYNTIYSTFWKRRNYGARIRGAVETKGGKRLLITKGQEAIFSSDENILYHNRDYTTIYIYQHS